MSKPIVDLNGEKYEFKQKGTDKPIYTVYAKSEAKAVKQLTKFIERLGLTFEDMERVG